MGLEATPSATKEYAGHLQASTTPWPRRSLRDEIKKPSGIDFLDHESIESLKAAMAEIDIDVSRQMSWPGLMDKLISSKVEQTLIQPCFLLDYPLRMSPLAKKKPGDSHIVERFEGFVAGTELCNAFTELNDPVVQRSRFDAQ